MKAYLIKINICNSENTEQIEKNNEKRISTSGKYA